MPDPRFIPTALPIARRLPGAEPPPLPSQRNLNTLGTGATFRSNRTAGDFGDETVAAPVGQWVDVVSTWVLRSRWDQTAKGVGDWYVESLDGALWVYRGTPAAVWSDFFNSSSKGQFIAYRCKAEGRPYQLLRQASRTVTARHRKARGVVGPNTPERRKYAGIR